jgi:nucleoside phosphorylase
MVEPEPPSCRVVVFAALGWECRAVLPALRGVRRLHGVAVPAWRGEAAVGEVWVVRTGIGLQRAAAAAAAIELPTCALVVSTGCAGGLSASLRAGDLVVATAVQTDAASHHADPTARRRVLALAGQHGLSIHEGPIRCSGRMLASRADKQAAAATGALAVEMEAAPLAAAAAAAARPFVSVRAVIDAADDDLATLVRTGDPDTGQVRPLALAAYVLRHPSAVAELRRLQRARAAAAAALTRLFAHWFASPLS